MKIKGTVERIGQKTTESGSEFIWIALEGKDELNPFTSFEVKPTNIEEGDVVEIKYTESKKRNRTYRNIDNVKKLKKAPKGKKKPIKKTKEDPKPRQFGTSRNDFIKKWALEQAIVSIPEPDKGSVKAERIIKRAKKFEKFLK